LDLHSDIIPGFFQVPVDNLLGEPCIAKYINQRFAESMSKLSIISKNAGGAKR
jgi:ribose-phosphate pyrophosphokinase